MKQSTKNKIEIVRNAINILNMEKKIDHIESQVSNHIPTQIEALDKRMDEMSVKLTSVVTIVTILIQLAFQYFG